jgi:hypothetical protein
MIGLYITVGIFYLFNLVIFSIIHIKKTNKNDEIPQINVASNGMISLFNNNSMNEPLLNQFV